MNRHVSNLSPCQAVTLTPNPNDSPLANRADLWWIAGLILGAFLLVLIYLSPQAFWIDSEDYVAAISEGKKVIHPPGYVGFIALADQLNSVMRSPYKTLQILSTALYLASIPFLHLSLLRHTTQGIARILSLTYTLNWICLNIATVGSSHSSDLLFTSIFVYLASLPRPDRSSRAWHPALFLTVVFAFSFRMSSVVMAAPFLLLVLLRDWRLPRFWISAAFGGLAALAVLGFTARCYGGWDAYRESTAALHAVNARAGLLTGGDLRSGGLNILRAAFWVFLALPLLPLLPFLKSQRRAAALKPDWGLLLPASLAGGVLFVIFGYLCVHPGYLAPALPALFVVFARILQSTPLLIWTVAAQITLALLIFFVPRPVQPPASARDAVANAFLLQFTASAHRQPVTTLSLSSWLFLADRSDLIPSHRRAKAEADARRASHQGIQP